MARSKEGLKGTGEWHEFETMLPDFHGKRVLDLGCGYGWHRKYISENGAMSVVGIDSSVKMIEQANKRNSDSHIEYHVKGMEDVDYPADSFEVVISSMAFHYLESFDAICKVVKKSLVRGGDFVFLITHPIFTAYGTCDWHENERGERLHWPLDNYFKEGMRHTNFLGEDVIMYHKTVSTLVNTLIENGFLITKLSEPVPDVEVVKGDLKDEARRPRF